MGKRIPHFVRRESPYLHAEQGEMGKQLLGKRERDLEKGSPPMLCLPLPLSILTNSTETGNDEEVEEFYAILRRIKVAVKYFEKGGEGRKLKAAKGSSLWSPAFEWEDFKKVAADGGGGGGGGGAKSREGVEDNVGLDLNADPKSDPESS